MTTLKNDSLIRALHRKPVVRTPVWFMRQAGRYLPEFRRLRQQKPNFMEFCKNSELAAQATLQPLKRFPLDAAIVFSDILTVVDAMGLPVHILPNEGPVIHQPIRSLSDVRRLESRGASEKLDYVFATIRYCIEALNGSVPLIGFAGSPFTVACYMVEGKTSKTFETIRTMLYAEPNVLSELLEILTSVTIEYLKGQIEAGVQVIMLFDTWGGILSRACYERWSLSYMTAIIQALKEIPNNLDIPLIIFTKGGGQWLELMVESGCDALGLDWTTSIEEARHRVGHRVALQGNLDPAVLLSNAAVIRKEVLSLLRANSRIPGYVFNLGHGILPTTPIENVQTMVQTIHEFQYEPSLG